MRLISIIVSCTAVGGLICGLWGAIIGGIIGSILCEIEYHNKRK